jgi:glycosyltransferase involved in cell wall biosynthesis
MEIRQVATGLISIPPNGWGAIERIIWEYKKNLEILGHTVEIIGIDQVGGDKLHHVHVANLALHCRDNNIPYVFSLHDHHVEWYGKGSWVYNQNLEAIKGSVISFAHAEHLVDYFDETDKLFYLPHGADIDFFEPALDPPAEHRLMMLANNGVAGDSTYDRKGFRYGIEAAKELDLPITVVGTDNILLFFDAHKDLLEYPKLTLIANNPDDLTVKKLFQEHTIFLHPSNLEAGHPNLTLLEAASCCLPVVGTFKGSKCVPGMYILPEISVAAVVRGIQYVSDIYGKLRDEMFEKRHQYDWLNVCKILERYYANVLKIKEDYTSEKTKELYVKAYNETVKHV